MKFSDILQQQEISSKARMARSAERAARQKAGACVSCGLTVCPGARRGKCLGRRSTPEEWERVKSETDWV